MYVYVTDIILLGIKTLYLTVGVQDQQGDPVVQTVVLQARGDLPHLRPGRRVHSSQG